MVEQNKKPESKHARFCILLYVCSTLFCFLSCFMQRDAEARMAVEV